MAYNIENYDNAIAYQSTWTTAKNMSVGGTLAVTGAVTLSAGMTATTISGSGTVTGLNATATTAGGATSAAFAMGTGLVGIYFGSGAPTINGIAGSLYLRTDGTTTSTRLYVCCVGGTTWATVTTGT